MLFCCRLTANQSYCVVTRRGTACWLTIMSSLSTRSPFVEQIASVGSVRLSTYLIQTTTSDPFDPSNGTTRRRLPSTIRGKGSYRKNQVCASGIKPGRKREAGRRGLGGHSQTGKQTSKCEEGLLQQLRSADRLGKLENVRTWLGCELQDGAHPHAWKCPERGKDG
ncbi:hypothetical protein LY78DRAFT_51368 [Colletotrichum sublineola]|nr:hypothetical protein LY78DRAFT_51368 [Colletotrichum sublineola]